MSFPTRYPVDADKKKKKNLIKDARLCVSTCISPSFLNQIKEGRKEGSWARSTRPSIYTYTSSQFYREGWNGACNRSRRIARKVYPNDINTITILHCYALILDPADVTAQLVLSIGILDQLRLHRESPHLFKGIPLQLHLIQDLRAYLDHFVRVQLKL